MGIDFLIFLFSIVIFSIRFLLYGQRFKKKSVYLPENKYVSALRLHNIKNIQRNYSNWITTYLTIILCATLWYCVKNMKYIQGFPWWVFMTNIIHSLLLFHWTFFCCMLLIIHHGNIHQHFLVVFVSFFFLMKTRQLTVQASRRKLCFVFSFARLNKDFKESLCVNRFQIKTGSFNVKPLLE